MSRNRYLVLILGLALTAVLSCSAGELPLAPQLGGGPTTVDGALEPVDSTPLPVDSGTVTPVEPPVDTVTPLPVDTVTSLPGDSATAPPWDGGVPDGGVLRTSLLVCQPQRYAADMRVIGPAGGQLMVGNHKLTIAPNALSEEVPIVMEQIEGSVNSVRFSPEGLQFAVPAILSLSYKNCPTSWHSKRIAYTDESLSILQVMPSLDFNKASQVKGLIYHFSRYAVAY